MKLTVRLVMYYLFSAKIDLYHINTKINCNKTILMIILLCIILCCLYCLPFFSSYIDNLNQEIRYVISFEQVLRITIGSFIYQKLSLFPSRIRNCYHFLIVNISGSYNNNINNVDLFINRAHDFDEFAYRLCYMK